MITIAIFLYFLNDSFRFAISDAYSSVFKIVITDRVLSKDASVHSNISYCGTSNPRQTLDIYIPDKKNIAPFRLVVFIHGGGWRTGDKSNSIFTSYGETFLKQDFAVASLNYRLYPEVTYPKPNEDIACAIKYLAKNITKYSLSSDNWVVFGDSAGAQLGAYAMSDPSINGTLSTFIGFYGPYDISAQINRTPTDRDAWNYTNKGKDAFEASPAHQLPNKNARYLIFHGEQDRVVPPSQSRTYHNSLMSNQVKSILTPVEKAGHYFSSRSVPSSNNIHLQILKLLQNEKAGDE